jgi:FkbM family methyltransferase
MTPVIHIRSFSDDQYWLDKIFNTNSYRVRGFKKEEERPIVVDIGAHCGYFTITSLALGAKRVYSFEPYLDNFKMLIKNLSENPFAIPHLISISKDNSGLKIGHPKSEKSFINYSNLQPVAPSNETLGYFCPSDTLSKILDVYCGKETSIDILKINIGYQERDILKEANLSKVQSICGETVLEPEHIPTFKSEMLNKGFINSHIISVQEEDNKIFFIFSKSEIEKYYNI